MKNTALILLLLLITVLASACQVPTIPAPAVVSPATDTPVPPTETLEPDNGQPCAFMWATESLPELSAELQAAVDQADLEGVTLRASAFGENCVLQDGRIKEFLAMQTDYYLTIPVEDLEDDAQLAQRLPVPLNLILQVPMEKLSGPNPGLVEARFTDGTESRYVRIDVREARESLQADPGGAQLIEFFEP